MSPSPILPEDAITTPMNAGLSSLSSLSTSDAGYQQWFTHYQVIWGMWKRVWQYNSNLTLNGGVLSGGPQVGFTWCDVQCNATVIDRLEYMNWANSIQEKQILSFTSDSSLSGYGVSGTFATVVAGLTRDVAKVGDAASNCTRTWNVKAGLQPGEYDPTIDTYSNLAADFFSNVVLKTPTLCTRFIPDLVVL